MTDDRHTDKQLERPILTIHPLQTCNLQFETYGYDMTAVVFKWAAEDPIQIAEDSELPTYDLKTANNKDCTKTYSTGKFQITLTLIKWPELKREFLKI